MSNLTDSIEKSRKLVKSLFSTEEGKLVLKYLKQTYVDGSALGQTPEHTYYNLGQKELVESLLLLVHDDNLIN